MCLYIEIEVIQLKCMALSGYLCQYVEESLLHALLLVGQRWTIDNSNSIWLFAHVFFDVISINCFLV